MNFKLSSAKRRTSRKWKIAECNPYKTFLMVKLVGGHNLSRPQNLQTNITNIYWGAVAKIFKGVTIVNYDSRVVMTRKLSTNVSALELKFTIIDCLINYSTIVNLDCTVVLTRKLLSFCYILWKRAVVNLRYKASTKVSYGANFRQYDARVVIYNQRLSTVANLITFYDLKFRLQSKTDAKIAHFMTLES